MTTTSTVQLSPLAAYMTPDELAAELGRSRRTLDRWHVQRVGPPRTYVGAGRKILYSKKSVERWLEQQEVGVSET